MESLHQEDVAGFVRVVMQSFPATDEHLEQIRTLQGEDGTCQQVIQYCQTEWPTRQKVSPDILQFLQVAPELNIHNGLLLREARIIIPAPQRC